MGCSSCAELTLGLPGLNWAVELFKTGPAEVSWADLPEMNHLLGYLALVEQLSSSKLSY